MQSTQASDDGRARFAKALTDNQVLVEIADELREYTNALASKVATARRLSREEIQRRFIDSPAGQSLELRACELTSALDPGRAASLRERILNALRRPNPKGPDKAALFAYYRMCVVDAARKAQRRQHLQMLSADSWDPPARPDPPVQLAIDVQLALAKLPLHEARAYYLYHVDELTQSQIAAELNKNKAASNRNETRDTVQTIIQNADRKLRALLQDYAPAHRRNRK